jgi:hypothetical protein
MLLDILAEVLLSSAVLLSPVFVALAVVGLNHELSDQERNN